MKYCDFHCDALTVEEGAPCVTGETLRAGGCLVQCFAAYIRRREGRFEAACALCDAFDELCRREGFRAVRYAEEIEEDEINALLTVEEGGAIEGDLSKLEYLFRRGVRALTLTWNYPNEIGFPNFPDYAGLCAGRVPFTLRERERGLTRFGEEAVARMNELGMLADVSHGSDKLVSDVARICKAAAKPFVASHSGADSVYACARNLTDGQIRLIAECGGVVGLDFCADFLSEDQTAEGQKRAILAHARAIVNAGGEDALCLGSDFDGIPENAYVKSPAFVPLLLEDFAKEFGRAAAEKFARGNFERVFRTLKGA